MKMNLFIEPLLFDLKLFHLRINVNQHCNNFLYFFSFVIIVVSIICSNR
jgi:hypothetical protein